MFYDNKKQQHEKHKHKTLLYNLKVQIRDVATDKCTLALNTASPFKGSPLGQPVRCEAIFPSVGTAAF